MFFLHFGFTILLKQCPKEKKDDDTATSKKHKKKKQCYHNDICSWSMDCFSINVETRKGVV